MLIIPMSECLPEQPYRLLVETIDARDAAAETLAVDLAGYESAKLARSGLLALVGDLIADGYTCTHDAHAWLAVKADEFEPISLRAFIYLPETVSP